ncbi:MAG: hypothetical protein DI637_07140 [Citromicrobium sp.]|nr:MAG: hypothetical protein DI637_07140 [Citromicrobium sp.]
MAPSSRFRQIGWALLLGACFAALLALTFQVNAVKSDVRLVERQIIAAERSKLMLETEFQTRASQHQLADWNAVEFGYAAPRADQYVEHERQLAVLGTPRGHDAPEPIRVAAAHSVDVAEPRDDMFAALLGDDRPVVPAPERVAVDSTRVASSLAQRLSGPSRTALAAADVTR